ncbi:alpha/beta hydrolase family protein [Kitasatospora sp. NPDC057015]|uniref:alpha/beta hydrolase family protein n=1 Tax=Kitasatospora sp. NPDC057015 TaxID=3346001 RepID=UPI0036287618
MNNPADADRTRPRTRVERNALIAHHPAPVVDLHLPTPAGPRLPLVIDVSQYAHPAAPADTTGHWAPALAAHGLAVAAIREPAPAHRHDALQTVRALVRLLRSGGSTTGPATDRIGLFGCGDGAYLAALTAYGTVDLRSRVQAVAGIGGAWGADLSPEAARRRPRTTPRRHPDAEVLHQVSEIALATGNDVPLLVVHQLDDPKITAEHGIRLVQVVSAAGGRASVLLADTYEFLGPDDTAAAVAAFFHHTLADSPAPLRHTHR